MTAMGRNRLSAQSLTGGQGVRGSPHNSSFYPSEMVALHGIAKLLGTKDLIEAQHKLMQRVLPATEDMNHVIHAIISALYQQRIGTTLDAEEKIVVATAPDFFSVWLPFFVNIPPMPTTSTR